MSLPSVRLLRVLGALCLTPLLTHCGVLSKVKVSKIGFPGISLGHGEPSAGTASTSDPFIPYDIRQKLSPGHTLVLAIYSGQRSPNRIFEGRVVIDEQGEGDFGKHGKTKLAGLDATAALRAISSLFNIKSGDRILNIQLKNIEDLPLLTVEGSVKHPGVIRWFDTASPLTILPYVGGRVGGGTALFITREGRRSFYPSLEAAVQSGTLMAGDILTYTGDL